MSGVTTSVLYIYMHIIIIALAVLKWRISAEGRMVRWLTISNVKFGSVLYFLCLLMHGLAI